MMVARPRRFREWVLVSEFPFDKYNIKQSVFSVSPEVKFSNKPYDVFKKIHKLKRFLLLKWELRRVESKEVDLFFCTGGDVNLLSEHLLTDSIRVYDPKEYLNIIKSRLSNNISREIVDKVQEIFDERFFIKNIGLYNLAILDFFRDRLVEVLNVGFLSENKLLQKFNRVFTGNHADSLINAIIHAAKKVGTKTFCLQHGGNSGYILQPECFRTEYYWSDYFISYGPGVDALLDNQNAPSRSSGLGSLYLNSFKSISGFNKDHKKKPTIFYLTSSFNAYLRHMGNYCYPDTWYYGLTLRVLDVLRKYSTQYDIVIKLHPKGAQGPFTKQNYEITKGFRVIDQAFESVWEEADAYIMDYCSTPLGLVLQTNKPLILLSEKEFIDFTDEAEKKLKLRALFTTNTNTFLHNIDLFMSQWNGKWTLNSSEFRDAYFKPSNNLQSYTRSLDDLGFK
jgi:hypothetical protein